MKKEKVILVTFIAVVVNFLAILGVFFVPAIRSVFQGPQFLIIFLTLFAFGLALTLFTIKEKLKKWKKRFLLLTGLCAAGIFPSIVIHNLLDAVVSTLMGPNFWTDEPLFFVLAIIVFPIGLLIGIVGSIYFITPISRA